MTTEDSLRNRTIGEIAATLPGATVVFRKFKLDYCCGGDVALAEAIRKRGLDMPVVEGASDMWHSGDGRRSLKQHVRETNRCLLLPR
jgi:regulator of cell morphogenesis and NO signaling